MTNTAKRAGHAEPQARPKRVRLSPEVRRKQILDAALVEFSAHGFAAASIAKIANRVGISKANVYAHFSSKDEIFETLLASLLERSHSNWESSYRAVDVDTFIDNFMDAAYGALTDETIGVIRLLVSEGYRAPALLQKFGDANARIYTERQAAIDAMVAAGKIKSSPLTENFSLVLAPIMYAVFAKMAFGDGYASQVTAGLQDAHRKLLKQLLVP